MTSKVSRTCCTRILLPYTQPLMTYQEPRASPQRRSTTIEKAFLAYTQTSITRKGLGKPHPQLLKSRPPAWIMLQIGSAIQGMLTIRPFWHSHGVIGPLSKQKEAVLFKTAAG